MSGNGTKSGNGAKAVSLAYTRFGEAGDPLVIVHGLFGSARNWQAIAKRLAGSYRVFAVDLRNHGESPWAPTMSFAEMADDLRAFLDTHKLAEATIIGHSVGGKTAMTMALEHPERVDRLVVVDIAPVAYDHSHLALVHAMQEVDLGGTRRRADVEERLAARIADAPTRLFLMQNVVTRNGSLAWRINLEAIAAAMPQLTDFPDEAGHEYDGRVLFVRGERSDYVDATHQDAIFALFPQAEFAVIDNAGHRVHAEQPDPFLARVRTFLESSFA